MAEVRTVAILLFDGVNSLDVAGPAEAFAFVRHADGTPVYRILTWGMGEGVVRSESGLRLAADGPAPDGATGDLLIIPGGPGAREPETLRAIAAWLRANQSGFRRVASVCTGAYPLAESGLMDGRTITTHWAYAAGLRQRYPRVKVRSDLLFSRDGKFYSSGGVTAGIDLALELIEADCGARAAMDTARELVVFLRRTGSQAQFSEPLKMQAQTGGDLAEVCLWAANNLGGDLSVEA